MAEPCFLSCDQPKNELQIPLGAPLWPKNVLTTPLMNGVKAEVSVSPTGFQVMFDFSALINGAGLAAMPAFVRPAARGAAKAAGQAAVKGAEKALPKAIEPASASTSDNQFLESLKTFLAMTPGLNAFLPAVDLAILLREISPLQ